MLWQHTTHTLTPKWKGEGESLMISDFLTPEWGQLKDDEECITFYCLEKCIDNFLVKHVCSFGLARTVTAILLPMTS